MTVTENRQPNRLIHETSPYLQQHAYNPVDWYPWGEEAFERARTEDKPLLVSIGYSACHWCHLMEHESFEDPATAALMNQNFVNIKVDMEERPDVDQIYMNFVQLTTGRGGWPMNVFITPDKRPFFGGTYFPPEPRYGMPSWRQILMSIAEAYRDRRDEIDQSANDIVGELRRMTISESRGDISTDTLDTAAASFARSFDKTHGGFGGAPKFPQPMALEFLLRYHHRTADENALRMVTTTLDHMAAGGMYDQLGGGFHRYSVDAVWLVPHFEKMLYDNAQLARIYLHAWQVTGEEEYRRVAVDTLEYVRREMLDPSGGFYSTQDADSEAEEGKFFVWTPDEIAAVLDNGDAKIFQFFYDITAEGNFEGKNILHRSYSLQAAAAALKISVNELSGSLERSRKLLFEARELRIKPGRDEKTLAAWNGLMLAAFADAAAILDAPVYLDVAVRNAEFIQRELQVDGRLLRTWKNGQGKLNGYLEDYANVADGMLRLYEVSGRIAHFREARRLADLMITEFWDEENGGFFFTSHDHEELVVRNKDHFDNATPSGNSVAADVLFRLARFTGDDRYARFALTTVRLAATQARRHPQGFGRLLAAAEFHLSQVKEVALIGHSSREMERVVLGSYRPDIILSITSDPAGDSVDIGFLKGREASDHQTTAYVCEDFVCQRPTVDPADLRELLGDTQKAKGPSV